MIVRSEPPPSGPSGENDVVPEALIINNIQAALNDNNVPADIVIDVADPANLADEADETTDLLPSAPIREGDGSLQDLSTLGVRKPVVPRHSCSPFCSKHFVPTLYLAAPLSAALMDAADIYMSLFDNPDSTRGEFISGPIAALVSTYLFNESSSKKNFREFCSLVKARKIPENWPVISKGAKTFVYGFMLVTTPFGVFAEATQAYFFVNAMPTELNYGSMPALDNFFQVLSPIVGIGVGVNKAFTDNYESFRTTWNLVAGKKTAYSNSFSRVVSPLIGYPFGVLRSLQDSLQTYIAIKSIFSIEDNIVKSVVGALAIQDGIPNFCFAGMSNLGTIDEFFGYLQKGKIEPKKIVALALAGAIATYLAFLKRTLNVIFYESVNSDLDINRPDITTPLFIFISWIILLQESLQTTSSIYPTFYKMVDKTTAFPSYAIKRCTTWIHPEQDLRAPAEILAGLDADLQGEAEAENGFVDDAPAVDDGTPAVYARGGSPALLFRHRQASDTSSNSAAPELPAPAPAARTTPRPGNLSDSE